ncbi:APC family permease [Fervidicoccus fontis]|uniref:Cationic amino acid transporter related protein n=1 Tax=Fervidicoccus fontis (strain DSM 19380 / JCM 18336 / VKM B-2539 / Kam940) TaxID=1163730 RepID=H9ZZH2_FERFK|nr:APC family permease [Fervidicoccus fontis]AFH42129.1 cationic amino acid transporter related protein [Fervidicoccus fontis Kam940]
MSKKITLLEAIMLGIGGMYGVGIFVFPGSTGRLNDGLDFLAWLITGIMMIAVGLVYSDMSSAFEVDGGPAVYPFEVFKKRALSKFLSFYSGAGFFVGWTIAITICAITSPYYLYYILPISLNYSIVTSLILIFFATLLVIFGVKLSGKVNQILTFILLAITLAFTIAVFSYSGLPIHLSNNYKFDISKFLASIGIIIGAYGAWASIPSVYSSVENPKKNVPLSVAISILSVAAIYVLMVMSLHSLIPYNEFLNNPEVAYSPFSYASIQLEKLTGTKIFTYLFSLSALLAIFTTMIVGFLSLSRAVYAMSEKGIIPQKIYDIDSKNGRYILSTVIISLTSSLFSLFPQYFYKFMVIGLVVGTNIPYAINLISYIYFKHSSPSGFLSRRIGIFLGIMSFSIIIVSSYALSLQEVKASAIALSILFVAYVIYYFFRK